jgi:L-ribulose-5-phosphate 3-epimerase
MNSSQLTSRLAVCSWSLQPNSSADLLQQIASVGIPRVQIALGPLREHHEAWKDFQSVCAQQSVSCVSGMFGTVGEDYSTLESIKRTGGFVPDANWELNSRNIQAEAAIAQRLGLKVVTFHAGFLPHEESDPSFQKLMRRVREVADLFASKGIVLGFETGQETAETLRTFLQKLDCPNVGVNFDPANMILYDKGDPIQALKTLGPWIRQCHIKDARRTKVPGTWGEEVVVGTGEVDWVAFFRTLSEIGFAGNLCIEREAGNQRATDIRAARHFLENLK